MSQFLQEAPSLFERQKIRLKLRLSFLAAKFKLSQVYSGSGKVEPFCCFNVTFFSDVDAAGED